MDDVVTVLALSVAMFVGYYLIGIIPLAIINFSQRKLKLMTILGAGLLVGTALAVIIPEGVKVLYSSIDNQLTMDTRNTPKVLAGHDVANVNVKNLSKEAGERHQSYLLDIHTIIGISLLIGFVFMLLVDEIGGKINSQSVPDNPESTEHGQSRKKITASFGLVVHSAADGVALGAAISMPQTHITVIVFLAIMLHKAPAAFGLVSFLMHEGFDRKTVYKHLAVFSVAAPLLAVITYAVLSQQNIENKENMQITGVAMLFGAGTFLYVATVHVLPEVSITQVQHKSADGTVSVREQKGFTNAELFTLVIGSLLPMALII